LTKFVVHIGDGKCGSSAIQAALFDAREDLAKIGIAYDAHHRTSGNYNFGTLLGKATRGNDEHQRRWAGQVVKRLRSSAEHADYVFISSEAFLTMEPAEIVQILEMISDDIESIDTIAYVRHPLSMYLSLAQQSVKASFRFRRPDTYRRPLHEFVGKWRESPLIDSVTVRLFDRTALVGNNVVADFEAIVKQLTGNAAIKLDHIDENTSLSAEQMVVMQDFRRRFHADHDNRWTPDTSRLIDFFTTMNEDGMVGHRPQLTPEAAAWVLHGNHDVLDWLGTECGLGPDQPAPTDLKQDGDWSKLPSILASVDPGAVHQLKMMIPAFNPGILSGDLSKASQALDAMATATPVGAAAIARAAEIYWNAEALANCTTLASA
jgi:hypothetical protein